MARATPHSTETRNRLLDAAGEVFAECGFHHAKVRDICERAGANLASVNYHFRSKQQLYAAVLRHAHGCAVAQYPSDIGLAAHASARQRLHAFVRSFLLRIFDKGRPAWFGKLIAREMVEPTAALDVLVEQNIRPQAMMLSSIVGNILGSKANAATVRHCVASVVGQCVFYHHARPVVERLYPQQKYTAREIDQLADHIADFSFAAMSSMAQSGKRGTAGKGRS